MGSTAGRPRYEIQLEIADTQHRFLDDGITPPRKRLNACEQFHERERLCKVVVTTRTQPAYAIVNFTESADNQNRRGDTPLPQASHDLDSVDVRQHPIYRNHGISGGKPEAQRIAAVDGDVNLVPTRRQRLCELARCLRVVFNDENVPVPRCHEAQLSERMTKGIQKLAQFAHIDANSVHHIVPLLYSGVKPRSAQPATIPKSRRAIGGPTSRTGMASKLPEL